MLQATCGYSTRRDSDSPKPIAQTVQGTSLHCNGPTRLCEPSIAARRVAWALARCRDQRVRMTRARECILRYLAGHSAPASLEMLTRAEEFHRRWDPTTIYRTLVLLKE